MNIQKQNNNKCIKESIVSFNKEQETRDVRPQGITRAI
jgi:hypothetical protein